MRLRAWLLLVLLLVATARAARRAAGWPSDNRLDVWLHGQETDPGFQVLRRTFGGDEIVLLRADGFTAGDDAALDWLATLGPRLARLKAVAGVIDPFHLPGGRATDPAGSLRECLDRPLARALDLAATTPGSGLRADLLVRVQGGAAPAARNALAAEVAVLRAAAPGHGVRLRAAGHPLVAAALDTEARRVGTVFAPLLALAAFLAVGAFFRSLRLSLLAVLPAVIASAGLRAAYRALDWPSNLILVASGPLVFVLVLATALHLLAAFRQRFRARAGQAAAARAAIAEKAPATLLAACTTAIGFGVFALSPVQPVRRLGLGIAGAMLLIAPALLLVLPPLLAGLPLRPALPRKAGPCRHPWRRPARAALRHRRPVLLLAAVGLALGIAAPFAVATDTDAMDYFPREHVLLQDYRSLEAEGCALNTLEVLVRPADGSPWAADELLAEDLTATLAAVPGVVQVFGPGAVAAELRHQGGGMTMLLAGSSMLRATGRLGLEGHYSRWTLRFRDAGAPEVLALVRRVDAAARSAAAVRGREALLAGTLPLLLRTQDALVDSLGESLGLTALAIALLCLLVVRSPREFGAAVFTNLLPAASALAATWLLGFRLDAATVMVAAVVLGLAVDNTFHLLHAARRRGGGLRGLLHACDSVGQAAFISSAALALGFFTLCLSGFLPTFRFGLLAGLGALAALAADLLLLPILWAGVRGPGPPARRVSRRRMTPGRPTAVPGLRPRSSR